MGRLTLALAFLGILIPALLAGEVAPPSLVAAKAAVLMDRQTGLVLWARNADWRLPMASTTKIMTAMVILDHGGDRLDEEVVVSEHADRVEGSSQFATGETVRLRDLLRGALIRSSNEATIAAGEYLAGSETAFVGWMNDKAAELGLSRTHFANPHGLYHPDHYSSALDLARMTRYALTNYPLIREIVATKLISVMAQPRGMVRLETRNKLLGNPVPGIASALVDGVKTGYVNESGKCFVASATQGEWQLIAVLLNSPDIFSEANTLLHYGFARYEWRNYATPTEAGAAVRVGWGASRTVPVGTPAPLGAPVLRLEYGTGGAGDTVAFVGKPVRAPVRKGDTLGMLEVRREGRMIATAPAIALRDIPVAWWARWAIGLLYWGVVALVLFVVGKVYGTRTKVARRRRRLQQAARRAVDPGRPSLD